MNEILESIKKTVLDRVSNPLFGTFAAIWLIHNWEIPVVLFFGGQNANEKIETINKLYINYLDIFIIPILFTAVFLFIYPILSIAATFLWEWTAHFHKKLKLKLENQIPKSQKEFDDFENKALELIDNVNYKLSQVNNENIELINKISKLEKYKQEYDSLIAKMSLISKLTYPDKYILSDIDSHSNAYTIDHYLSNGKLDNILAKATVEKLIDLGMLQKSHDGILSITEEGKIVTGTI